MQLPKHPFPKITTAVSAFFTGSWFAAIDDAWNSSLRFLRGLYDMIGIDALKEFSRMFQRALQHPGVQLLNDHLVLIVLVASLIVGAFATMVLWRALWTGMWIEKAAFKTVDKDAVKPASSSRDATIGYFRFLLNDFLQGLVLFLSVSVVTTVLFIFGKTLWFSYLASPVGRFYPIYFPHRARLISMVLGQDMFIFPIMLTTLSFGTGMICSAVCRFFYLTRYIYLSKGMMGRILLLALPLNIAAAAVLRPLLSCPHWGAAYAATLIPMLLSFNFCFRFTNRFLPEMGMLFRGFTQKNNPPMNIVYLQNLHSGKTVLEFDPLSGRRTGKRFPNQDGAQTQGQFLLRRGHEYILYRYGRDLFFQVDDLEVPLCPDMSAHLLKKGRFSHRFELSRDDTRLFRLNWSTFPLSNTRGPTARFFDSMEEILRNREVYESAFIIEDDPERVEPDFSEQ